MLHIINTWLQSRIVREDEGATMVEYGLMVALIAAVVRRGRRPRSAPTSSRRSPTVANCTI